MMRYFICAFLVFLTAVSFGKDPVVLFDARDPNAADPVPVNSKIGISEEKGTKYLSVQIKGNRKQNTQPGFAIDGRWDLSGCNILEFEFVPGSAFPKFSYMLQNSTFDYGNFKGYHKAEGLADQKTSPVRFEIPGYPNPLPGCNAKITYQLRISPWDVGKDVENGYGGSFHSDLDPKDVRRLFFFLRNPKLDWTLKIKKITALYDASVFVPKWRTMSREEAFPFIDRYGQFKHDDWKEKIHEDADLVRQRMEEAKDLAAHPGPEDWDRFGGWKSGPQYKANGHFRVEKIGKKWQMIDPDGRIYWSHGPVRITTSGGITAIDTRENYFEFLPKENDPDYGIFYKTRDSLYEDYLARGIKKTYDFSSANMFRKYGPDWKAIYADLSHQRLRSWGMNTIANGSEKYICEERKTPYTDRIMIHSKPIAASKGVWWPFNDPFDPSFRENVRKTLMSRKTELDDPWCIGFFVDNEITWGNETSLAVWTLQSPADQEAKKEFVRFLKKKYGSIEDLCESWKIKCSDWEEFLRRTDLNSDQARSDCREFNQIIVDAYFRNVREVFKSVAPNTLYMGCRFAGSTPDIVKSAAKYCDVLSFNIYRWNVRDYKLPEGVDLPIMVGEFHFGTRERGLFYPGLLVSPNEKEEGIAYEKYIRSALEHPNFVGAHWFQWSDMPLTGRFDGANARIGLIDLCDTPYKEFIKGVRKVGYQLYQIRCGKP
ncbi:MAG: beta-galactosidase [Planctomycetia bacterium]|nr:beta-galactosidase [Planctomycetia bacterium]